MTTLTDADLDCIHGGNDAANLTPEQLAAGSAAANYQLCKFATNLANGPFPKGGSLDQMVAHTRREQQGDLFCAKKFPL